MLLCKTIFRTKAYGEQSGCIANSYVAFSLSWIGVVWNNGRDYGANCGDFDKGNILKGYKKLVEKFETLYNWNILEV